MEPMQPGGEKGGVASSIIALALTAQLSGLGLAFRGFALVLLPVVFFLGW
jgi:hypothetical protein